jgi:hypothetical protein
MHHISPRKNLHPSPYGKGKKEERKMLLRLQEKKERYDAVSVRE